MAVSKEIVVTCLKGFHVRVAAKIAKEVKLYPDCNVTLTFEGNTEKAKSSLKICSLGILKGSTVTVTVDGENEAEVLEKLLVRFQELQDADDKEDQQD